MRDEIGKAAHAVKDHLPSPDVFMRHLVDDLVRYNAEAWRDGTHPDWQYLDKIMPRSEIKDSIHVKEEVPRVKLCVRIYAVLRHNVNASGSLLAKESLKTLLGKLKDWRYLLTAFAHKTPENAKMGRKMKF